MHTTQHSVFLLLFSLSQIHTHSHNLSCIPISAAKGKHHTTEPHVKYSFRMTLSQVTHAHTNFHSVTYSHTVATHTAHRRAHTGICSAIEAEVVMNEKKQNHLLSSFFLCCCIQWENRTVNPTLSPAGTSRGFECVARCLYCHLYVCGQTFQITISHPARCNLKNDNWAVDIKIEFKDGCGLTVLSKDYFNMLRLVKAHRKMISTLVLVQILSLIFMLLHNVLYKLILNTWNTGLCCLPSRKIKKKYPFGSPSTEESMRLFTLTWMSWLIIPTLLRCKTLFILGIQPNCVWWPSPTSRTSQINENKIIYKTTRRKGDK